MRLTAEGRKEREREREKGRVNKMWKGGKGEREERTLTVRSTRGVTSLEKNKFVGIT